MAAGRDIRELVHRKQIEILKAVEDAIEQQELELWRLRKSLVNALHAVDRMLEIEEPETETRAEMGAPRGRLALLARRYDEMGSVAAPTGESFPQA